MSLWVWQLQAVSDILFFQDSIVLLLPHLVWGQLTFFSLISSLYSLVICWHSSSILWFLFQHLSDSLQSFLYWFKACKYYTLLSKYILLLLIILILSIFDIYQDAYLSSVSIVYKVLHMFLLPDVVSAAIAGVAFITLVLSVTSVSTELAEILNMILSYKTYLPCWWRIMYVLHVFIYIHISEYVRTIFWTFLSIFFNICRCISQCKFIVYKVFV